MAALSPVERNTGKVEIKKCLERGINRREERPTVYAAKVRAFFNTTL